MQSNKVTIRDFFEWTLKQIDAFKLSTLMSRYGYTDDSVESLMDCIRKYPSFVPQFKVMLIESINAKKAEMKRTNQVYEEFELSDWRTALSLENLNFATGLEGDQVKQSWWDANGKDLIGGLLGVAGGTLSSIFGNNANQQSQQQQQQTTSGSMTFLWIVLGVVLLAVVGIFAVSLSRKK